MKYFKNGHNRQKKVQKCFWNVQKLKGISFTWWNVFPRALTTSPSTKRLHFAHFVPKFVWNFDVNDNYCDHKIKENYDDDDDGGDDDYGDYDDDEYGNVLDSNDDADEYEWCWWKWWAPDNIWYNSSGNLW